MTDASAPGPAAADRQRRMRKIAMTAGELDAFLAEERTCRVATVSAATGVHNTPLWFAWDGSALWLTSIVRSQRWVDLERDPRVAVVVDAGHDYTELRGVEITGRVEVVGPVPRPAEGPQPPGTATAERLFAEKYSNGVPVHDGRHGWLRVVPDKLTSWDFRKIPGPAS